MLPPIISPPKLPPLKRVPFESAFDVNMNKLMETRRTEVVYLNIYNVSSLNTLLECFGFGLYHTSIEIYKHEFSYGGHDQDCSGIVCVEAGNCAGLTQKERIVSICLSLFISRSELHTTWRRRSTTS